MDEDPHDLQRFVQAQQGTMAAALAELRAGTKRTHWMWWVFPQLAVLGRSATAQHYGLAGLDEARAYLAHPLLGERLRACAQAAAEAPAESALALMGSPDDLKLRSSMTLFALAAPDEPVFGRVLARWYGGRPDPLTRQALGLPAQPG